MKGSKGMFGSGRRIFAGKKRLREEPFCPFVTDDTGYHDLFRNRNSPQHNPGALGNTGSFGPVQDLHRKRPANRRWQ